MSRNVIILDIDNCIADDAWRIPLIEWDKEGDERYHRYHASAYYDRFEIDWATVETIKRQPKEDNGNRLFILTARPVTYRELTLKWLRDVVGLQFEALIMRNKHDHRKSHAIKHDMLRSVFQHYDVKPENVLFAADDRQEILDAYRDCGLIGEQLVLHAIHNVCAYTDPRLAALPTSTGDILRAAARTFDDRNAVYGNNYRMVGPMMKILFPDGAPAALLHSDQFHLFEIILVKLSRFAVSNLTHQDSIRDAAVYAAMIESIVNQGARK